MEGDKLYGLDLFSGIGGITLALEPWVKPVAYCEIEKYAQSVLLQRQFYGDLPYAPIWDDVTTLRGTDLPRINIIYGGFPCQDISCAGRGVGISGKRSGLFSEILRLAEECEPEFLFLENVPAIRTRGLDVVVKELARIGYDSEWFCLSAESVGANHKRNRWFLLAHTIKRTDVAQEPQPNKRALSGSDEKSNGGIPDPDRKRIRKQPFELGGGGETPVTFTNGETWVVANSKSKRRGEGRPESTRVERGFGSPGGGVLADPLCARWDGPRAVPSGATNRTGPFGEHTRPSWWAIEPDVGRMAHGVPARVDRIRGLGNAVVPLQAREAFKKLMKIEG